MAPLFRTDVTYPVIDVSRLTSYTRHLHVYELEMYQDPATGREYLFKPTLRAPNAVAGANVMRLLGVDVPPAQLAVVNRRAGYWQEWYYGFPDELMLGQDAPGLLAAINASEGYRARFADLQVADFVVRRGDAVSCNRLIDVTPGSDEYVIGIDMDTAYGGYETSLPAQVTRGMHRRLRNVRAQPHLVRAAVVPYMGETEADRTLSRIGQAIRRTRLRSAFPVRGRALFGPSEVRIRAEPPPPGPLRDTAGRVVG